MRIPTILGTISRIKDNGQAYRLLAVGQEHAQRKKFETGYKISKITRHEKILFSYYLVISRCGVPAFCQCRTRAHERGGADFR